MLSFLTRAGVGALLGAMVGGIMVAILNGPIFSLKTFPISILVGLFAFPSAICGVLFSRLCQTRGQGRSALILLPLIVVAAASGAGLFLWYMDAILAATNWNRSWPVPAVAAGSACYFQLRHWPAFKRKIA